MMLRRIFVLLLLWGVLEPTQSARAEMSRAIQDQTVKALKMAKQDRWTDARNAVATTRDPLAAKIYHWYLFKNNDRQTEFTRISQFIRQNPDWPGIRKMREKAEENYAGELSPRDLAAWFDDFERLRHPARICIPKR